MKKKHPALSAERIESRFNIIRTVIAIAIALVIAFLLILTVSKNPLQDFMTLLFGPISHVNRIVTVVSKMIPLLFTGIAVSLIYSAGQINIATEGAFFGGCVASTAVALIPGIPPFLHIPLCLLSAVAVGAIIMGLPGFLHVHFGVVTIVSSLMINYVSLYLGMYFILNPLRDPSAGFEGSYAFQSSAILPKLFFEPRLHLGLLLGVIVVVFGAVLLKRTRLGFRIRSVGSNQKFSNYVGMNVGKTIISTSLISGGIAGAGGAVELLGNYNRFMYSGFTNHGWDGIMIAVLCRNNPKAIPFGAFFLAYLKTAADTLNLQSNIPPEIISVIQAVIIIFVAAESFLSHWEHKKIVENARAKELKKETA